MFNYRKFPTIKVKWKNIQNISRETLVRELERNYNLLLQDTEKKFIEFAVGFLDIQGFSG